jgi:anti-anti-sigma factor
MGPSPKRRVLKIAVTRGGAEIWSGRLAGDEATIGRSPEAEVVLDDPQVSWIHARVSLGAGGVVFKDVSTNGSYRNGERVTDVSLGSGGVISIPPFEVALSVASVRDDDNAAMLSPGNAPAAEAADVAAGASVPIAELRLVSGPESVFGAVHLLEPRSLRIGRASDCDIRLNVPGVSRHHATLAPAGEEQWRLTDAGSRNAVAVNGKVVRDAIVGPGDRIGFGTDVVAILARRAEAPMAAPSGPSPTSQNIVAQTVNETLIVTHAPSPLDARVTAIRVYGRLDGYSFGELADRLTRLIREGRRFLAIDLSECVFCDHVGLGVLVNAQVAVAAARGGLRLFGLNRQLKDAFFLLRLDDVLSLGPDERAAVLDLKRLMEER